MKLAVTLSDPDLLVVVPDYHPDYGHSDNTRAEVLRLVRVEGLSVREAAARSFIPVARSTVYKWLADSKKDL